MLTSTSSSSGISPNFTLNPGLPAAFPLRNCITVSISCRQPFPLTRTIPIAPPEPLAGAQMMSSRIPAAFIIGKKISNGAVKRGQIHSELRTGACVVVILFNEQLADVAARSHVLVPVTFNPVSKRSYCQAELAWKLDECLLVAAHIGLKGKKCLEREGGAGGEIAASGGWIDYGSEHGRGHVTYVYETFSALGRGHKRLAICGQQEFSGRRLHVVRAYHETGQKYYCPEVRVILCELQKPHLSFPLASGIQRSGKGTSEGSIFIGCLVHGSRVHGISRTDVDQSPSSAFIGM